MFLIMEPTSIEQKQIAAARAVDEAEMPTTIEGWYQARCRAPSDIYQHLPLLRRFAEQCFTVTELGVRTVVSTWAFLAGLQGRDGRLLSVDYIHPKECGGDLEAVARLAQAAGIKFEFRLADDREIELLPTDLLFIDTWHVYEQLKAELTRHADKAQKFIILHDTETFATQGETEGHSGLLKALDEFLYSAEGQKWFVREQHKNCNGLTVLERRA